VRAGFTILPSGAEVHFISADSYMSVQMIDCASGRPLHEYVTRSGDDFCHTDYWLSAGRYQTVRLRLLLGLPVGTARLRRDTLDFRGRH
jgi:hypothetical protein